MLDGGKHACAPGAGCCNEHHSWRMPVLQLQGQSRRCMQHRRNTQYTCCTSVAADPLFRCLAPWATVLLLLENFFPNSNRDGSELHGLVQRSPAVELAQTPAPPWSISWGRVHWRERRISGGIGTSSVSEVK